MKSNFSWKYIKEKDFETLNEWHNVAIEIGLKKGQIDGFTKYLTNNDKCLIGEHFKDFLEMMDEMKCKVACVDNEIVGVILYCYEYDKKSQIVSLCIEEMAVSPIYQGKGVGTAMIFDVVKYKNKIFENKNTPIYGKLDRTKKNLIPKIIKANVDKTNIASQKAFEKNGFYRFDTSATRKFYDYKKIR